MEKIIFKIALGFLALFIMGAGCEKVGYPGEFIEKPFLKFSDFGCPNEGWHIRSGYTNNHYIVNSQQKLEKYITSDCVPKINFSKYNVIIGSIVFTTGASLYDENLEENNEEIVYTVTILTDISLVVGGVKYHVVIGKPSGEKNIRVEVIVKDHT